MSSQPAPAFVVLDDHELVREGIQQRLAAEYPKATFTYSGDSLRSAIAASLSESCDCAVIDLDLGDGTPVAEVFSAFTARDIPVVVVSAMATADMPISPIPQA